ncbi:hypothetical protein HZA56_13645 [Candidatus Poribacteria bacterium]|nr:hypothetical protein [Candidatus Poribacteria bacterium]
MTKHRFLTAVFLSFLLALFFAACRKEAEETPVPPEQQAPQVSGERPQVTGADVEEKAQEALEAAKSYTLEQKEEYQKKAGAKLQEFDARIKELKAKAEKTSAETKVKLDKQIEELQKKQKTAREKLEELKSSGEEAWAALKREMDTALADIEDFIKNLLPSGE